MSAARLLHLNTLRQLRGKPPLKAWKESNAKLEAAIAQLEEIKQTVDAFVGRDTATPLNDSYPIPVSALPQMTDREFHGKLRKLEQRRLRDSAPRPEGSFTLAQAAAEIGMQAPVARAKWRKLGNDAPSGKFSRYEFAPEQRNAVMAILNSKKRK